jgi:hypothetical protein
MMPILLSELQHSRARLAYLLLNSPADPDDEGHGESVLTAQRHKESLEAELARHGSNPDPEPLVDAVSLSKALRGDARLLSYIRHA